MKSSLGIIFFHELFNGAFITPAFRIYLYFCQKHTPKIRKFNVLPNFTWGKGFNPMLWSVIYQDCCVDIFTPGALTYERPGKWSCDRCWPEGQIRVHQVSRLNVFTQRQLCGCTQFWPLVHWQMKGRRSDHVTGVGLKINCMARDDIQSVLQTTYLHVHGHCYYYTELASRLNQRKEWV